MSLQNPSPDTPAEVTQEPTDTLNHEFGRLLQDVRFQPRERWRLPKSRSIGIGDLEDLLLRVSKRLFDNKEQLAAADSRIKELEADTGELTAIRSLVSDRDEVGTYAKVEAAIAATDAAEARNTELAKRASRLEDAAFHFQTCRVCRLSGEDACPDGTQFAAFLRGEADGD